MTTETGRVYSHISPPPDIIEAKYRLDELEERREMIRVDLDYRTQSEFDDESDYLEWRHRATRALGHVRAEWQFLKYWLDTAENAEQMSQLTRFAATEAKRILRDHPLPHATELPQTLPDLVVYETELRTTMREITGALLKVVELCNDAGVGAKRVSRAKAPLLSVHAQVETHLVRLRSHRLSRWPAEPEVEQCVNGIT